MFGRYHKSEFNIILKISSLRKEEIGRKKVELELVNKIYIYFK
jgi:hypothetical protein